MIKLKVIGKPEPQGSVSAFAVRKAGRPTGRVVVTGDNPKIKSWRQAIIDEVRAQGEAGRELAGPLAVSLTFVLDRPAGHYGKGRNARALLPSAPLRPDKRPDIDKLARSVLDALTDARVWRDDAQVVSLWAVKSYALPGEPAGCIIEVDPGADGA